MAFPTLSVTPGVGATINTLPAAGQDVKANSLPVVIASDQGALSVSGTFWQTTQPVSGTFWQATQPVSIASMPTTPVTGTFWQATQPVSLASVPTHGVAGDVASGTTDSGNPQKIGGVAKTTNPTAVTDGQRVNALFDKLGKQVVIECVRELRKYKSTTITSSTTETTIVAAGGAGVFNDLYALTLSNSSATVCDVTIRDGTGGTVLGIFRVGAGLSVTVLTLDAGSAIPQTAANTTWSAQCSASVASIQVTALYAQTT